MTDPAASPELIEAVRLVVELQLGCEAVELHHHLAHDLAADSFDLMTIVAILEEDHQVAITEQAASEVRTVGDLVNLVASSRAT